MSLFTKFIQWCSQRHRRQTPKQSTAFVSKYAVKTMSYGIGIGGFELHIGQGMNLPPDLRMVTSKYGTVTWYSTTQGDRGAYLRRYPSGVYAIHLGVWFTRDDLDDEINQFKARAGKDFIDIYRAAMYEINRRACAIENYTGLIPSM